MRSPPPSGPPPPTPVEGPATGGKRPTYQNGRRHVPRDVGGAGDNAELPGHSCSPPPHRHTMHAAACLAPRGLHGSAGAGGAEEFSLGRG